METRDRRRRHGQRAGNDPQGQGARSSVRDRWNDDEADGMSPLELLAYGSRLIGEEPSLVLWGGGNTSLKVDEADHMGRTIPVLRVKGSGSDLKYAQVRDFAGVRLGDIRWLLGREAMTDEEMVDYIAHCTMEPQGPRPSIETLLHGFLAPRAIVHSHADAILTLVDTPDPARLVKEIYGDRLAQVAYLRPGFAMAKVAYEEVERAPEGIEGLVLLHHGLVTWGDTMEEAYHRHIALVTLAEEAIARAARPRARARAAPELRRNRFLVRLAPFLKGALSRRDPHVLMFDGDEAVVDFLARPDAREITQRSVATPDHILHTKGVPLWLDVADDLSDAALGEAVRHAVDEYEAAYAAYVERYNHGRYEPLSPEPRVILVPGLGYFAAGRTLAAARVPLDIYRHTMGIIAGAQELGGYHPIAEPEAFEVEYWPLELYKLTLRPRPKELAGKVALVTGAGSGIGRACALALAQAGAVVAAADLSPQGAAQTAAAIEELHGMGTALGVTMDVGDKVQVDAGVDAAVARFGGIDIVVSNAGIAPTGAIVDLTPAQWEESFRINTTGHFLVSQATLRVMRRQGTGGAFVFVVTKNALVPGKEFGAYSCAKSAEAQLARIIAIEHGGDGIRANMVNPDAVWTGLWSEEVRRERASAYHIAVDELEDFYRRRSLLQRVVLAEDVAESVLFLCTERSSKTTGAILPVDAGIREAFPR